MHLNFPNPHSLFYHLLDWCSQINMRTSEYYGITISFADLVLVLAVWCLAGLAIRGTGLLPKIGAVCIATGLSIAIPFIGFLHTSFPAPLTESSARIAQQQAFMVVAVRAKAPKHIFVVYEAGDMLREFFFPWTQQSDDQLNKVQQQLAEEGRNNTSKEGHSRLYLRIKESEDRRMVPEFYLMPPEAPPLKDGLPLPQGPALTQPPQ